MEARKRAVSSQGNVEGSLSLALYAQSFGNHLFPTEQTAKECGDLSSSIHGTQETSLFCPILFPEKRDSWQYILPQHDPRQHLWCSEDEQVSELTLAMSLSIWSLPYLQTEHCHERWRLRMTCSQGPQSHPCGGLGKDRDAPGSVMAGRWAVHYSFLGFSISRGIWDNCMGLIHLRSWK